MADFGIGVERSAVGVAWIVLRNPARLNALRLEMWQALPEVVRALDLDPAVRVLVLRGAGEEAFASGADISEFATRRKDAASAAAYEEVTAAAFAALLAVEKPVVAMIRGVCIGGGLAIAACADLRIASHDARLALPAARLGLGYHQSGVERLVALLGPAAAAELFFTARQYTAAEALQIGLLNRVVSGAELGSFTEQYVEAIARNAPLTLRAAKRAILEAQRAPEARDPAGVARLIAACFESADYAEGVRAFLEKRPPRFRGA
jgi:enoyl-CoA hydratase